MVNRDTIAKAVDGKYTDFSNIIKSVLHKKLANHDISKQYSKDFDRVQGMKNDFEKVGDKYDTED